MHGFFSNLFGPIFAKELVEMARRWRYYLSRMVFGLVLLLTIWFMFEITSWRFSSTMTVGEQSQIASEFFSGLILVQFLSVYFFVPLFVCGVVCVEREKKTLDLLFTTHLKNREIIFGKLLSRLFSMLMLLAVGLPITYMISLMGGIDSKQIMMVGMITFLAMLHAGAHAIYFSTITKSPLGALIRTYWWLFFELIAVPYLIMMTAYVFWKVVGGTGSPFIGLETIAISVSPLFLFIALLFRGGWGMGISMGSWQFWVSSSIPYLFSLFLIWRAVANIRREPKPTYRFFFFLFGLLTFWRKKKERLDHAKNVQPSRPQKWLFQFPVENPIWLRARRAWIYDREGHVRRVQWALILLLFISIIYLAIAEARSLGNSEVAIIPLIWFIFTILLSLIAGYSIQGERNRGLLELMLVSPMPPSEILKGTFLAIWRHVKWFYWLILIVSLTYTIFSLPLHRLLTSGFIVSFLLCSLYCVFLTLHSIACSLSARTMAGALVGTFFLPVVYFIGLALIIGFTRRDNGVVIWVMILLAVPISLFWIRFRKSVAAVTFFSFVLHVFILGLFALTSIGIHSSGMTEAPGAFMHPVYVCIAPVENADSDHWYSHYYSDAAIIGSFSIAIILNCVILFAWLCRNFDRLSGRAARIRPSSEKKIIGS